MPRARPSPSQGPTSRVKRHPRQGPPTPSDGKDMLRSLWVKRPPSQGSPTHGRCRSRSSPSQGSPRESTSRRLETKTTSPPSETSLPPRKQVDPRKQNQQQLQLWGVHPPPQTWPQSRAGIHKGQPQHHQPPQPRKRKHPSRQQSGQSSLEQGEGAVLAAAVAARTPEANKERGRGPQSMRGFHFGDQRPQQG